MMRAKIKAKDERRVGDSSKRRHPPHEGVFVRLGRSELHGVGVIAIKCIPKGTRIFYGDDEPLICVPVTAVARLSPEIRRLYRDFCVLKGKSYLCPRNFNRLTVSWYLNHSDTPNVRCDEEYDFYAARRIRSGEELTVDYGTYSDDGAPTARATKSGC